MKCEEEEEVQRGVTVSGEDSEVRDLQQPLQDHLHCRLCHFAERRRRRRRHTNVDAVVSNM